MVLAQRSTVPDRGDGGRQRHRGHNGMSLSQRWQVKARKKKKKTNNEEEATW